MSGRVDYDIPATTMRAGAKTTVATQGIGVDD
jgi:hypothetical protein